MKDKEVKSKPEFKFSFELSKEDVSYLGLQDKIKYWSIFVYYYTISFFKWLPRNTLKHILPKHEYAEPILDGTTPIGYITKKGKKVFYGKHYKSLYFWGMIK